MNRKTFTYTITTEVKDWVDPDWLRRKIEDSLVGLLGITNLDVYWRGTLKINESQKKFEVETE